MSIAMPEIEASLGLRLNDAGRLNLIVRSSELSQEIQISPKKGSPAESVLLSALLTHQIMTPRGVQMIDGTKVTFTARVLSDGLIEAVLVWDQNILRLTINPQTYSLVFHQPYSAEAMRILTSVVPALGLLSMNLTTPREGATFVSAESLRAGQRIKLNPAGSDAELLANPWVSEHKRVLVRVLIDGEHTTVRLLSDEQVQLVAENVGVLAAQIDSISDENHSLSTGTVRFTHVPGRRVRLIASYFDGHHRQDYVIEFLLDHNEVFLAGQIPSAIFDKLCELVPAASLLAIRAGSAHSKLYSDLLRFAADHPDMSVTHDGLVLTVHTSAGSALIDAKRSVLDLGTSQISWDELVAAAPLLKAFDVVTTREEGRHQNHWRETTMDQVGSGKFLWREGHVLKRRDEVQVNSDPAMGSSSVVAPDAEVVVVSEKLAHLGASAGLSSKQDWLKLLDALVFAEKHGLDLS